jgi:nicotinate phosphoribosyltransferase
MEVRSQVMREGARCVPSPTLNDCADRAARELALLPQGSHRLVNPHLYKVSISQGLNTLRLKLVSRIQNRYAAGQTDGDAT